MSDTCKGCPQAEPDYDPENQDNTIQPFCNNCTRTITINPSADAHKFVSLIGFLTAAKKS
jgi:hypothetical protein